jgi:hypothetical protein
VIPALCCVCGTQREVSRQAMQNYERVRKLKCATCKVMTAHAGVFGPGTDWREQENRRAGVRLAP